MKILLFGSSGQVGWQLRRSLAPLGEVIALHRGSPFAGSDLLDIQGIGEVVATIKPDVVVNAAAYTAVDKAEDDPDSAFAINARACEAMALASAAVGAWIVQYSTDYVYDGSGTRPWLEVDAPAPLSVYGRSKLAGDEAVVRLNPRHLVLRTSWVFDSWGQNFAKSILKAAAEREELGVVSDQWGAPTRAALIADVTAHMLRAVHAQVQWLAAAGVYHVAAAGETSWHGYAQLLLAEAAACGLPVRATSGQVKAIPSSSYPVRAARPANSRLDTTKLRQTFDLSLPAWQEGVRAVVAELAQRPFPKAS